MSQFDLENALDRAVAEPDSRRAALIRQAEKLFASQGYHHTTVRDVADAAGVNVATLHLHWKSKATLYEAVCRLHARHLLSFIAGLRAEAGSPELSAKQRIGRWVDSVIDLLVQRPAVAPMALESVSGQAPPDLPNLFQHDVGIFRFVADEIAKLMPDDDDEPMLILLALFYMGVVTFSDSPLQQALLGGSVYQDDILQERLKRFGRIAMTRLLGLDADGGTKS